MGFEPFLSVDWGKPDSHTLSYYQAKGGYQALKKALAMAPDEVTQLVKDSGLRGRGGAGFPTGMKWGFVPKDTGKPVYLAINADESEPGTFKDKYLLKYVPHMMLEGIAIAAHALQSFHAFVYIRGEFPEQAQIVQAAIREAESAGFLGKNALGSGKNLQVTVIRGAGAYICGEETGMLSSIEGDRGNPKLKPPFPAVSGAFKCPTIVNNVETICNVPFILERGVDWFRSMGTEKSPGSKLFCFHGHINKPRVVEVPLGHPFMDILERFCGGVWKDRTLKAVIPGGSSAPILTADDVQDLTMDYEGIAGKGSMLGSGAVTILDDTTDIVDLAYNIMRFYHHESCGQCTPCREGTGWLEKVSGRIAQGGGRNEDLDLLEQICGEMMGRTICALADAAVMPIRSYITKFRTEFEAAIAKSTQTMIPVLRAS